MKYLKTADGRIVQYGEQTDSGYEKGTFRIHNIDDKVYTLAPFEGVPVIMETNRIETMCDKLLIKYKNSPEPSIIDLRDLRGELIESNLTVEDHIKFLKERYLEDVEWIRLALWNDKGLIFVAEVNEEGKFDLI